MGEAAIGQLIRDRARHERHPRPLGHLGCDHRKPAHIAAGNGREPVIVDHPLGLRPRHRRIAADIDDHGLDHGPTQGRDAALGVDPLEAHQRRLGDRIAEPGEITADRIDDADLDRLLRPDDRGCSDHRTGGRRRPELDHRPPGRAEALARNRPAATNALLHGVLFPLMSPAATATKERPDRDATAARLDQRI